MALSEGMKLARVLAIAGVIGCIMGVMSRLILVGNRSNVQILHSAWGWAAVGLVVVGLYGLATRIRKGSGAARALLYTLMFSGGIMWAIPLPFTH